MAAPVLGRVVAADRKFQTIPYSNVACLMVILGFAYLGFAESGGSGGESGHYTPFQPDKPVDSRGFP